MFQAKKLFPAPMPGSLSLDWPEQEEDPHLNAIYYILLILTAPIDQNTKGHFSSIIYKFIQIQTRNDVTL